MDVAVVVGTACLRLEVACLQVEAAVVSPSYQAAADVAVVVADEQETPAASLVAEILPLPSCPTAEALHPIAVF
jgi:hypothetical protein